MAFGRRTFRLCFALWFIFVVTEPIPFHECAMHNPLVLLRHAAPATARQSHVMHGTPSVAQVSLGMDCGHMDASHVEHAMPGHSSEHQGPHNCSCLGCCSGTPPVLVPHLAGIIPVPVQIAQTRVVYPLIERAIPAPEFILPPSTAPPV